MEDNKDEPEEHAQKKGKKKAKRRKQKTFTDFSKNFVLIHNILFKYTFNNTYLIMHTFFPYCTNIVFICFEEKKYKKRKSSHCFEEVNSDVSLR